jgi:hypothetical protein
MTATIVGWYYEWEGRLVGPVSLEEAADLLDTHRTRKVWKACREGEHLRFYRMPAQTVLSARRRTEEV